MNYEQDAARTGRINEVTVKSRIKGWVDNFKANLPEIAGGYAISSLIGKMKDVPVVVVGSGPTLDRNIHHLRGLEDKALIICGGSNVLGLQKAGINPHLVLMSDSLEVAKQHVDGVDLSKVNYVLDTFIHPIVLGRLMDAKRIYWYNSPHLPICPFTGALSQWTGGLGIVVSGGCGATAQWQLSRLLGCNPDILVGLPEAYYDPGQQYAKAVTDNHSVYTYAESEVTEDNKGIRCYTNNAYKSFAAWFEHAFMNIPGQHINCSEGGIIKQGCLIMPLAECAERVLTKTYDIESMLFADELLVDKWYGDLKAELPEDVWWTYRSFLTMMMPNDVYGDEGHTNLPEICRRMNWTPQKVAQTVLDLRALGVIIQEEPCQWTPDPNKAPEITLRYWVEGSDKPYRPAPDGIVETVVEALAETQAPTTEEVTHAKLNGGDA
jgi:hypothetical protein